MTATPADPPAGARRITPVSMVHDTLDVTANEQLKRRSQAWLPRSIVLAVIIHVAVLSLAPELTVADVSVARAPDVYVVTPPLDLPPPPEQIARPAAPVVGTDIDADVTVPHIPFDEYTPDEIRVPKHVDSGERDGFTMFVPSMIAPALLNAREVERELLRNYPPILRDAGVSGKVDVHLWLDESGGIVKAEIAQSSGHEAFDAAALRVVRVMRLSPARNRNTPVRVIVVLPVHFDVK
jgi:TonB family protein